MPPGSLSKLETAIIAASGKKKTNVDDNGFCGILATLLAKREFLEELRAGGVSPADSQMVLEFALRKRHIDRTMRVFFPPTRMLRDVSVNFRRVSRAN
jgi:hypothetical protein